MNTQAQTHTPSLSLLVSLHLPSIKPDHFLSSPHSSAPHSFVFDHCWCLSLFANQTQPNMQTLPVKETRQNLNNSLWQQHMLCLCVCVRVRSLCGIPFCIDFAKTQQEETRITDYRELISKPLVAKLQRDRNRDGKTAREKEGEDMWQRKEQLAAVEEKQVTESSM